MSQIIPIYIPTLISDVNYNPTKVYPRLFFYNGLVNCEPYWFQYKTASGSATIDNIEVNAFPYVDHYNVVSGSFPTGNSKSLLFQNETPVYGATPTGSLYSDYWQTYINLLYDPKTRLINCSGIIPLADYFKMELNDIVEWRGNYYHLRAINEYNLATGDCQLQLLGPIIKDTFTAGVDCSFDFSISDVTTTTTTTQAPGPTTTTTQGPVACFSYQYGPAQSGCNIQWVNCNGTPGTTFVAVGQYYTVPCMREGSGTGCGQWTKGASCGVTTTTTTQGPGTTTTTTTQGPGTTTTTTTQGPVTTTSTTLPPTTTTTTQLIPASDLVLYSYTFNQNGGGVAITFRDWNNITREVPRASYGNTYRFLAVRDSIVTLIPGGTLSIIQNSPITPTTNLYRAIKNNTTGLTTWTYQDVNGAVQRYDQSTGTYNITRCATTNTAIETYDPLNQLSVSNIGNC